MRSLKRPGMYCSAAGRWAGVGPYYAMFPAGFADRVVEKFTARGDIVLDPFAGRGTSVFSAATRGRRAIGIEINPVGWLYARAKLWPAPKDDVLKRFEELGRKASRYYGAAELLPRFFHRCFHAELLPFLVAAQHELRWRHTRVDATAMALMLVYLHGKRDASFSNQMRQTKAMSPGYAVKWWRRNGLAPPKIEPISFLSKRLNWRYAKGVPNVAQSQLYLGDCTRRLHELRRAWPYEGRKVRLLFTSPPYWGLTNYYYDQWLRLWLLGGPPNAKRVGGLNRGKFEGQVKYQALLERVFKESGRLLRRDGIVYVRTDRRKITYRITRAALREAFPSMRMRRIVRPFRRPTQTRLFGDASAKAGEVDLILTAT